MRRNQKIRSRLIGMSKFRNIVLGAIRREGERKRERERERVKE